MEPNQPQVPNQPNQPEPVQPQQISVPENQSFSPSVAPIQPQQPTDFAPSSFAPQPQAFTPPVNPMPMPSQPVTPPLAPVPGIGVAAPALGGLPPINGKKTVPKWVVPAAIGIVVILVLGFLYMTFIGNKIALETYKGDGYSVLVPKAYEKDSSDSSDVEFKEKTSDTTSQSIVTTASQSFGDDLTDDQISQVSNAFDDGIDSTITSSLSDSDNTIADKKIDKVTYDGDVARRITASVEKDGKKVGTVHMLVVFDNKGLYVVSVVAHISDKSLENNADKILDSLKIDN